MGKVGKIGLAHGTKGSPQGNLEQSNLEQKVTELATKLKNGDLSKEEMAKILREMGVKFNEEDLVFLTKDKQNQTVWLEKGNDFRGLKHITTEHTDHFRDEFGVKQGDIPSFLQNVLRNGTLVRSRIVYKGGKPGYEKIYKWGNKYILFAIGTNGFIVTAYPYS